MSLMRAGSPACRQQMFLCEGQYAPPWAAHVPQPCCSCVLAVLCTAPHSLAWHGCREHKFLCQGWCALPHPAPRHFTSAACLCGLHCLGPLYGLAWQACREHVFLLFLCCAAHGHDAPCLSLHCCSCVLVLCWDHSMSLARACLQGACLPLPGPRSSAAAPNISSQRGQPCWAAPPHSCSWQAGRGRWAR